MSNWQPIATVVIPAFNEGKNIEPSIRRLMASVELPIEVFVVVDFEGDTTKPVIDELAKEYGNLSCVVSELQRGPAFAIRFGMSKATTKIVVVTMGDGCDDPMQIDTLIRLVDRGVSIASASRYMPGGQQVGGPVLKKTLSKIAGKSLNWLRNSGTNDATNSFKAYSSDFLESIKIESEFGFEMGLELVAKAIRQSRPIAEIPTIWLDRTDGESKFELGRWLPKYIRWYLHAFGKKIKYSDRQR